MVSSAMCVTLPLAMETVAVNDRLRSRAAVIF